MRYLLYLFLLLSTSSVAQQMSYGEWKEKAKTEINLVPEYGKVKKDKSDLESDQKFIDYELKELGSLKKASEEMIKLGFDYLYRGDLETSMKRFNQAWLLDSKNENAYWGFAAVYFMFKDYDEALKQLDKGLVLNPNSSNILTDKATIYAGYFVNKHDVNYLNKSIALFIQSYKIDPRNQNTLFKLSVAYFYKQDCVNALKYYNECMKLGGQPVPKGYADALKKQCGK
jgi:tetratricopeptide (TPR) repeat protein